ncbi:MAG TPA: hypothetical protein VLI39_13580 [Sedimentisphaerales bacterium]|nr:hypothetical protein [Sedimentisphaerales bacterium]
MWSQNSVVRSVAVCLLAVVVVLVAAGPARAVPSIEFTDQPGGHPLVVTRGIPTLEELPPELRSLLAMLGGSLPESNPEVVTDVGMAHLTALLPGPVGVEAKGFTKIVDGMGAARGLVYVFAIANVPAVETFFVSDSHGSFASVLRQME